MHVVLISLLMRRHPWPKPDKVSPVSGNMLETGNLLLCATCGKGQLWTMTRPNILDVSVRPTCGRSGQRMLVDCCFSYPVLFSIKMNRNKGCYMRGLYMLDRHSFSITNMENLFLCSVTECLNYSL